MTDSIDAMNAEIDRFRAKLSDAKRQRDRMYTNLIDVCNTLDAVVIMCETTLRETMTHAQKNGILCLIAAMSREAALSRPSVMLNVDDDGIPF